MFKRQQKRTELPTSPIRYPHKTYIHTEKGYFYIVNDTKRYRLISRRVVESWRPHRVVETSEAAVKNYRIVAKMKFRDGSLIWNLADGKLYLIENGKRRWMQNPEWFYVLGLDPTRLGNGIQIVSLDEINLHEEGEPLS